MALALAPNQAPPGSRPGSPIEVIDTFTDHGQTRSTCVVPISEKAIAGQDVVVVRMGFAHDGFGHFLGSFGMTPAGAFVNNANQPDLAPSNGTAQAKWFTRVVADGDPGRDVNFFWSADVFVSWAIIVQVLRYADLDQVYDTGFFFNASAGDTLFSSTLGGPYNTASDNALIMSMLAVEAGPPTTGIGPGPLPGWYDTIDANGGIEPNLGLVGGHVDMPTAGRWQGAACAWSQGSPGAFGAPCDFAAITTAVKAMQPPASPVYTLSPLGTSIDMAGASGTKPKLSWLYTPTGGQGKQAAWLAARQEHGTGANAGYWNANLNAWVPAPFYNAGKASEYEWPDGAWQNDRRKWDLYGAVVEERLGYHSPLTFIATFTADPPPDVLVTSPVAQTLGTAPVMWTPVLSAGFVQTNGVARIFSSDQYLAKGFSPEGLLDDDTGFPSAAGGIGGWTPDLNCGVVGGALGLNLTATAGGDMAARSFPWQPGGVGTDLSSVIDLPAGLFGCTPGDALSAFAWFKANTTARNCLIQFNFFDSAGHYITRLQGADVVDSSAAAVMARADVTVPAGAAFYFLRAYVRAAGAGELHFVQSLSAFPTALAPKAASGLTVGALQTWMPPALRGGAFYKAFVRIMQTGGQLSPWESSGWYANYANQPQGTLAVVASTDPVTGCPCAVATISGHDPYSLTGTTKADLWRYDRDAQRFVPVRNGTGVRLFWPGPYQMPNGLSAVDADLETGVGNWVAYNGASRAQSTALAFSGTHSLEITCAGPAAQGASLAPGVYAASPGQAWCATAQMRAGPTANARSVYVILAFRDAGGAAISEVDGAPVNDSTAAWTQPTVVSGIAPAGTASVIAYAIVVGASAGEKHYVDAVVLAPMEQFVTVTDYEMPPNTEVQYQARVYSTSPSGP